MIKIAVDAMGGDYAPAEIVKGAIAAARKGNVEITLVGPMDTVAAELAKYDTSQLPIHCVAAEGFIQEGENPAMAVRRNPNASVAVAARMVKEGDADGFISAGPTGAVLTSAIQYLGTVEGIKRPVMGGTIFDAAPDTTVFDCGSNVDCKPYHLLTFAIIGSVYCKKFLNIANPTIGLLNIGAEEGKGNQLTRETYRLLKKSNLNFIGNIEGNQIMSGRANVLVCDGFVGNILFKFAESIGLFKDVPGARGYNQGGGLILGINGTVRKMHGASRAPHVAATIYQAKEVIRADFIGALKSELISTTQEIKM
ncbi:MAG: phosphate acyltransferase PlsX [Dehalococcoidales bacterium]|nr:phosphate acyltransferase PlsX [Dehalococcoidales bacterium]